MPASPSQQEKVAARRLKALAMRAAGATYPQIARECGHKTPAAAAQDVTRALQARKKLDDGQAPLSGVLEAERIDMLERTVQATLRRASTAQDGPLVLKAAGTLLGISKRREALLGIQTAGQQPQEQASPVDELRARRVAKLGLG
jgi:hypothetical protein